jgi:hypothetical protein
MKVFIFVLFSKMKVFILYALHSSPRMFIPPGIPAIPRNSIIFRSSLAGTSVPVSNGILFQNSAQANVATQTLYH